MKLFRYVYWISFASLITCLTIPYAQAGTLGVLTYSISGGEVTITACDAGAAGVVDVPALIEDQPVTRIGNFAFDTCSSLTGITLPDSLTTIGSGAFIECSSITNITLPASVSFVDYDAFYLCAGLLSIDVETGNQHYSSVEGVFFDKGESTLLLYPPARQGAAYSVPIGVTVIEYSAFADSTSLTNITLPENLASIGLYSFWGCSALSEIVIPPDVVSIDDNAFYGCESLSSSTFLGDAPAGFGSQVFHSTAAGFTVYYWVGSAGFTSPTWEGYPAVQLGLSYDTSGDTAILTDCHTNVTGLINIPASYEGKPVTAIGNSAFASCASFTGLSLPSSIVSIGDSAFQHCSSLVEMTLPAGVTNIDNSAFRYCSSLTDITLPSGITSISSTMFEHCSSLTDIEIPGSVTNISDSAFAYCSSLTDVTIPPGVAVIGDSAFQSCSSLIDIVIPSSVAVIRDSAFQSCSSLFSVTLSSGITGIGASAFQYCSALVEIAIPGSVTNIGASAFQSCSSLTDIFISAGAADIGDLAFNNCSNLSMAVFLEDAPDTFGSDVFSGTATGFTIYYQNDSSGFTTPLWQGYPAYPWLLTYTVNASSATITGYDTAITGVVEIPATIEGKPVTSIGTGAFDSCSSLTGIILPDTIVTIRSSAFYDCSSLTDIVIPEGVTGIGGSAFERCTSLESISLPSSVTSIGERAFFNCSALTEVVISDGVTSIGERAFERCDSLKSISLPPSVMSIGTYAFYSCRSLSSISMSEGLNTIGTGAFYYCSALSHITIPASVTSIGSGVFNECNGLISIAVEAGSLHFSSESGILFNASQTRLIKYPAVKSGAVYAVPSGVTRIESGAFAYNRTLTDIILPSNLTYIGYEAFESCSALAGITIPASVTTIGSRVFSGCSSLEYILVDAGNPDYVSLDGVLLDAGQTELICYPPVKAGLSFDIPATVSSIAEHAFGDCSYLESITIPGGLDFIGSHAFNNAGSLESIAIPAGITSIPYYTFNGCSSMLDVSLPAGLTTISHSAFANCTSLTNITIPASVTEIGSAFWNCPGLSAIDVESGNLHYKSVDGVLFNAAQTELIKYPAGKPDLSYVVPDGVTSLNPRAFGYSASLASIELPAGLLSIWGSAFGSCSSLTGITIPASVTNIYGMIHFDCEALEFINVETGNVHYVSSDGVLFDIDKTELVAYPPGSANTSFTFPASVNTIVGDAFRNSNQLQSYFVEPGNTNFSSINGVLFNADQSELITYPEGRAGPYTVPAGVTKIGSHGFYGCSHLTAVTLPEGLVEIDAWGFELCSSLTEIALPDSVTKFGSGPFYRCSSLTDITIPAGINYFGWGTFWDCSELNSISFLGNAPGLGKDVFLNTPPDLTIHYLSANSGFSTPTWQGVPATPWFMDHEVAPDADLTEDPNGDGVNLLTAYALNLNPDLDLSGSLPGAEIGSNTLSMTYYAVSPGVTYTVETCEDLAIWTTNGVSVSEPDPANQRSASVSLNDPHRFMRLKVEK